MASDLKVNKRPKDDHRDDEDEKGASNANLPKTMRAIRCTAHGAPKDTLKLEEVSVPSLNPKKPQQVLSKVLFASINPIDYKLSTGMMGPASSMKPPYTPGFDLSGRVVAKGASPELSHLAVGDLIFGQSKTAHGSFAEYAICNGKDIRKMPASVTPLQV